MENKFSNQCNTTSDCVVGQIIKQCYTDVPWSDLVSFCDCSSWYGFVGERCDQLSPQVVYLRIVLVLLLIWSLVVGLLSIKEMCKFLAWKRQECWVSKPGASFYTVLFNTLGIFSLTGYVGLQLHAAFDATAYEIASYRYPAMGAEDVVATSYRLSSTLLVLASVFYLLSSLCLCVSWIIIADSLIMFVKPTYPRAQKAFKICAVLSTTVYTLVGPLLILLDSQVAFAVIFSIVLAIQALFVVFSRSQFVFVLTSVRRSAKKTDKMYRNPLRLVRRASTILLALQLSCFIAFIAFLCLFSRWEALVEVGTFNIILFCKHLCIGFALALFTSQQRYSHSIMKNLRVDFYRRTNLQNSVIKWSSAPDSLDAGSGKKSSVFKATFALEQSRRHRKKSSLYSVGTSSIQTTLPRKMTDRFSLPQNFPALQRGRTLSGSEIRKRTLFDDARKKTNTKLQLIFDSEDFEVQNIPSAHDRESDLPESL